MEANTGFFGPDYDGYRWEAALRLLVRVCRTVYPELGEPAEYTPAEIADWLDSSWADLSPEVDDTIGYLRALARTAELYDPAAGEHIIVHALRILRTSHHQWAEVMATELRRWPLMHYCDAVAPGGHVTPDSLLWSTARLMREAHHLPVGVPLDATYHPVARRVRALFPGLREAQLFGRRMLFGRTGRDEEMILVDDHTPAETIEAWRRRCAAERERYARRVEPRRAREEV